MKRFFSILAALALLAFVASAGLAQRGVGVRARPNDGAEKRVALVIGNANYGRSMGRLINPANDAVDMARTLRGLGFQVTHKRDLDLRGMEDALEAFSETARGSAVALFYFAGHGVQVKNVNYLVPLRARLRKQLDAKYNAIPASKVVDYMESSGARANIVILDACRNNPLPKTGRSAARGLAPMAPGSGTLIAFAAGPGQEADENSRGRNGLYTQELLKNMRTPGISIIEVFQRTRQEVYRRSRKRQTPQDWNSLVGGSIYLAGSGSAGRPATAARTQPRPPPPPPDRQDAEAWEMVKSSKDIDLLREFMREFPDSRYVRLARFQIKVLEKGRANQLAAQEQERRRREAERERLAGQRRRRIEEERREAETRRRNREAEERRLADERRRQSAERRRQAAIRRDTDSRTWRDPVTGMQFVKVPGGSFQMGCHANAGKCYDDEKPVRTVRLDGFWLGKHEVTQGQWKRVMGSNPSSFKKGDNYPVENVSWNDVQQFIRRLNSQSSAKFGLPSEAQWEYACRAGGKAVTFGTGNGRISSETANFNENNGGTTLVGQYRANGLGLKDMSGNVYEWVQDKFTGYGNVGTDNPIYERSGGDRVIRGGGWRLNSRLLRCSYRYDYDPSGRLNRLGFRLRRSR